MELLARISYVYIMVVISLDRSFVLNSCNSQYIQFYCLSYLQSSVYSSKEFVTLVHLCLYLVLLLEQPLQHRSQESVILHDHQSLKQKTG